MKKLAHTRAVVLISSIVLASCHPSRISNLTVVQQQVVLDSSSTFTATATCPSGTTRIGGGFQLLLDHDTDPAQPLVRGNFPDNANGWVAQAQNFANAQTGQKVLQVVAYCLSNAKATQVQVVPINADLRLGNGGIGVIKQVMASCPTGTSLSGGGYRIDGPLAVDDAKWNGGVAASYPTPDAWNLTLDERFAPSGTSRKYQAFAVCATPVIDRGSTISAPATLPAQTADATATCDDTHYATAGGFQYDTTGNSLPYRILASGSISDFKTWNLRAIGLANFLQVTVLCSPVAPIQ